MKAIPLTSLIMLNVAVYFASKAASLTVWALYYSTLFVVYEIFTSVIFLTCHCCST